MLECWPFISVTIIGYRRYGDVLILKFRNHLGLTGHFTSRVAAGSCANPLPSRTIAGEKKVQEEGRVGYPSEGCEIFLYGTARVPVERCMLPPGPTCLDGAHTRLSPCRWKHVAGHVCWGRGAARPSGSPSRSPGSGDPLPPFKVVPP